MTKDEENEAYQVMRFSNDPWTWLRQPAAEVIGLSKRKQAISPWNTDCFNRAAQSFVALNCEISRSVIMRPSPVCVVTKYLLFGTVSRTCEHMVSHQYTREVVWTLAHSVS